MIRMLLFYILPILLFILFYIIWVNRHKIGKPSIFIFCGLFIFLGLLLLLAFSLWDIQYNSSSVYTAPKIENGQIVPYHIEYGF